MAFKATNILPVTAYERIKQRAVFLKTRCNEFNTYMASNDIDYDYIRNIYLTLVEVKARFDEWKTTNGLAEYAQGQEVDPTYNIAAEFTTLLGLIDNVTGWIETNVPLNVTLADPTVWDEGYIISNTFTPAQTAGLRTQIDTIIAQIV